VPIPITQNWTAEAIDLRILRRIVRRTRKNKTRTRKENEQILRAALDLLDELAARGYGEEPSAAPAARP
jgi:hypothetical protein